jgi:hypothetical protein
MIRATCRRAFTRRVLCGIFFSALLFPTVANAQDELQAFRQVAYESGHGTVTLKQGPGGGFYALNQADRCVWMFSSSGSSTGHISSIGMGPSDLLSPKDLAVDSDGNAIVADASGAVKIFSPSGHLLISFPFERPQHVASMSGGRILVSGFPKDYLISIFDRQGKLLGKLGTPAKVDDDPFFNSVLNMGAIFADGSDNIYYVFTYMLTPTVRKYKPDGTLVAEWHLSDGKTLEQNLAAARLKYQENKKSANYGGVPILTAVAFDQDSGTLWVASGAQITLLDSSGHTLRIVNLALPDGKPLQTGGMSVERDTIRASTYLAGIFEYQKPH